MLGLRRSLVVVLLFTSSFGVMPASAGVSYRVIAVAETTTVTIPHPTAGDRQLHDPPPRDAWGREMPRPPVSRAPRRSTSRPIRMTADVRIEGPNIRIDNDHFDGRLRPSSGEKGAREILISRDGGQTFTLVDLNGETRQPLPVDLTFNPAAMGLGVLSGRLGGGEAERIRVERDRAVAEGIGPFDAQRTRVRAWFEVPADERFRRPRMKVTSTMDVWTTIDIPARVPPGLHAWSTGFAAADAAVRESVKDVSGFPVKAVMQLTMDGGRSQHTTTTTLEVTDVRVEPLDPATFDLP